MRGIKIYAHVKRNSFSYKVLYKRKSRDTKWVRNDGVDIMGLAWK